MQTRTVQVCSFRTCPWVLGRSQASLHPHAASQWPRTHLLVWFGDMPLYANLCGCCSNTHGHSYSHGHFTKSQILRRVHFVSYTGHACIKQAVAIWNALLPTHCGILCPGNLTLPCLPSACTHDGPSDNGRACKVFVMSYLTSCVVLVSFLLLCRLLYVLSNGEVLLVGLMVLTLALPGICPCMLT